MSNNVNTELFERAAHFIDMPTHKYLVRDLVRAMDANDLEDLHYKVKACEDLERELNEDNSKFESILEQAGNDEEFLKHV